MRQQAGRSMRLLSIDGGGGIRGLPSLFILAKLMRMIQIIEDLETEPLPCNYFDMICGNSTGGIIALMLGRLRMSVSECITAYLEMNREVFVRPQIPSHERESSAKALERVIKRVVQRATGQHDALLRDRDSCKTFVCTFDKKAPGGSPILLRTYEPDSALGNCKIWEAARATSATPTFFPPIIFQGRPGSEFIEAGVGFNNPTETLIKEAKSYYQLKGYGHIQPTCIVSIGAGQKDLIQWQRGAPAFLFGQRIDFSIAPMLAEIAIDCEVTHDQMMLLCSNEGVTDRYFRFNNPQGMQDIPLDESDNAGEIESYTEAYLGLTQTKTDLIRCVELLGINSTRSSSAHSAGAGAIPANQSTSDTSIRITIPHVEQVAFLLHCDLPRWAEEQLQNPHDLKSALTVSGGEINAYAAACKDYLALNWPNSPWPLLELIETALRTGKQTCRSFHDAHNLNDRDVWIPPCCGSLLTKTLSTAAAVNSAETQGSLAVNVNFIVKAGNKAGIEKCTSIKAVGTFEALNELLSQLQWLIICFRTGNSGHVSTSTRDLDAKHGRLHVFARAPQIVLAPSCWHPLLPGMTIAVGYPIPERSSRDLTGIEMPFRLMTSLATIWYPLEFQGGIILKGYSTALIPTAIYTDAVQWHYITSDKDGEELTLDSLRERRINPVPGHSLEEMSNLRSILGFFDDARIVACTKGAAFASVQPSQAETANRFLSIEREVSVTAGVSKIAALGAAIKVQLPKEPRARVSDLQRRHLEALIRLSVKKVTVMYDEAEQMGWMIPENCAILHVAICRLLQEVPDADVLKRLPSASADHEWDATQTFDLLKTIRLCEGYGSEPDWFLSEELKQIIIAFHERRESDASRNDAAITLFEKRSRMRAWDVYELMQGELSVLPRVVKVPGARAMPLSRSRDWPSIQRDNDILILCGRGFGELIKPASTDGLCTYRASPILHRNGNLLATIPCIKLVTLKCTGEDSVDAPMLSKELYCRRAQGSSLFRPCAPGKHSCNRLQELSTKQPPSGQGLQLHSHPNGAVLFGSAP